MNHAPRKLSVILPYYSGVEALSRLLISVEQAVCSAKNPYFSELIIIDDNPESTDQREVLLPFVEKQVVPTKMLWNEENIGFVSSVNRGFARANEEHDILLLNSDTIVYPGFFDHFFQAVSFLETSHISWASITPFTNAGTIATIPELGQEHHHFPGQCKPETLAKVCSELFRAYDQLPEIPVGVGFCMLIHRQALTQVGTFSEIFSPGYGEETQWCLRARELGFKHFLLPQVFVYHEGGGSFSERKASLVERATRIVSQQYPEYQNVLQQYLSAPESYVPHHMVAPYYQVLSLLTHHKVAVHLAHKSLNATIGGVERYIQEAMRYARDHFGVSSILIHPIVELGSQMYQVYVDEQYFTSLSLASLEWMFSFLSKHEIIQVESVTLQHAMNWNYAELIGLSGHLKRLSHRQNVLVHDYYLICRQHNLLWNGEKFCDAPRETVNSLCGTCEFGTSVSEHRAQMRAVLANFTSFVCPSESAKRIFCSVYPELLESCEVHPHYLLEDATKLEPGLLSANAGGKVSILFLGAMGKNKGIDHFAGLLARFGKKFSWVTVGIENRFAQNPLVRHLHYNYQEGANLKEMLQALQPAFLFAGSITKETFSYTLCEALEAGIPVLTTMQSGNIADMVYQLGQGLVFENIEELVQYLDQDSSLLLKDLQHRSKPQPMRFNRDANRLMYGAHGQF